MASTRILKTQQIYNHISANYWNFTHHQVRNWLCMPTKRKLLPGQSMLAECSWFIFLAVLPVDAEAICLKGNQCSWLLNKLIFTGQYGSWSRAFKILVLSPVHHKSANLDTFLNHQAVETTAFMYIAIICPNSKTRILCTKLSRQKYEFWRQNHSFKVIYLNSLCLRFQLLETQ